MRRILLLFAVLLSLGAQAQSDALRERATKVRAEGGAQLTAFKKDLAGMWKKAKKEKDYIDILYAYYYAGDSKTPDSLAAIINKKYPKGVFARSREMSRIYEISGAKDKESFYQSWVKKFPVNKLGSSQLYDEAAYRVALAYASEKNVAKANEYLHKVSNDVWKCMAFNSVGNALSSVGEQAEAGKILKEGCEVADRVLPSSKGNERKTIAKVYASYADWLAENGRADEAWQLYTTKVSDKEGSVGYQKLSVEHGRVMQAWTWADDLLRKGYGDDQTKAVMQSVWQKVNGNLDGFDAYVKGINDARIDEMLEGIAQKMIDKPAPDFTLKDIDGNTVQLSKLRGKVVVLDFWATWCGPCKRSLPAMKMTVDKYKNDPDVVLLFIHTWERGTAEQANKDAKAYLYDNGFDEFHLVMDTRNPETKKNEAVSAFGVTGIPAKFVIDKQGHIRFQLTGFGGSNEDAVAELSKMIELARKNS